MRQSAAGSDSLPDGLCLLMIPLFRRQDPEGLAYYGWYSYVTKGKHRFAF